MLDYFLEKNCDGGAQKTLKTSTFNRLIPIFFLLFHQKPLVNLSTQFSIKMQYMYLNFKVPITTAMENKITLIGPLFFVLKMSHLYVSCIYSIALHTKFHHRSQD